MKSPSLRRRIREVLTLCVAACLSAGALEARAQEAGLGPVPGQKARALPAGAAVTGAVPGSQELAVTLYMAPPAERAAALTQFLADVQTPGSAVYRQFVTPAQFAARFGATAEQMSRVQTFAANAGLTVQAVGAGGLEISLRGTAARVEAAFAPSLAQVQMAGKIYVANRAAVSVPVALAADVVRVGGLSDVPAAHAMQVVVAGTASPAANEDAALAAVTAAVEANAAVVLTLRSDLCVEDVDGAAVAAMQSMLQQAAAQGMTVLASSGCGARGSASFPGGLAEVSSVATAPGIAPAAANAMLTVARPLWQAAPGLPADAFRHEPDVTVASLDALQAAVQSVVTQMPAAADESAARVGSLGAIFYELAPVDGMYAQADGAKGTWEAATGLGVLNLEAFQKAFPRGTLSTYITVTANPYYAVHGSTITFTANVKDTSGAGKAAPTGTVTFTAGSINIGTATLVPDAGGALSATASVQYNQLPGNGYAVTAQYSGDGSYAGGSNQTNFTVSGEEGQLSATASTVPLGGTIVVSVVDRSASGVGTPSVTAYVIPQGIANQTEYDVPISGSGGAASGTINVPATAAGSIALLVGCKSNDPSFTCYKNINITANVTKATPTVTLSVSPNPPVSGSVTALSATVTGVSGSGMPVPTGTVTFQDNGSTIGSGSLDGTGKTTFQASGLSATATHSFTAQYQGDGNYNTASSSSTNSSGAAQTSLTLTVSPNPPVSGQLTTLTAAIGYTSVNGAVPTGTVTFYLDGVATGTSAVDSTGKAVLTSTQFSSTTGHVFYAVYSGDTVYTTSTSNTVTTASSGNVATTLNVSASANTVVSGQSLVLSATISPSTTVAGTTPTGTVTFSSSQGVLCTATVSNNAASCSATFQTTGTQTVTARYSGDTTYASSSATLATPVSVTNGSGTTTLTVTATPVSAPYGSAVALHATLSTQTTGGITGPNGSITFTLTSGATTLTYTALNNPQTQNTAVGDVTIPAPPPGTYTVTATCTGSNYSCTGATASTTLITVKAATTTTLTANPSTPTTSAPTTFTATVASAVTQVTTTTGTVVPPSGTVTFYINGTSAGTGTLVGGVATFSTTLSSATGNTVTAVYGGDTNYNTSTSSALTLTATPVTTSTTLTANPTTGLAGSNVILTASVSLAPTTSNPTPGTPSGSVTFYDLYNGQQVALGTATLVSTGPYTSVAQISTTGLMKGVHTITAVFAATTSYSGSTSSAVTVTMTDYGVTFAPAALVLTAGSSGTTTATITSYSGFTGQVVLGCTAPSGVAMTCSFNPTVINGGSGTSVLTVTTTAASGKATEGQGMARGAEAGSVALLLLGFLAPGVPRRRPVLLAMLATVLAVTSAGCTNIIGANSGSTTTGTPKGTQLLTITTSGTDGQTTTRHNLQVQVTVD